MTAVAERHGTTPGTAAVASKLRKTAVDDAIVGFWQPDQVEPIIAASNLELSEGDIAAIEWRSSRCTNPR
jgi:aryl-alcohol dehydrogenase-like predicted oxidoreductase